MMGHTTPRNNFEFLRLIFAVFVLFTHSYMLSGKSHYDFVDTSTNFQIGFSYMGVRGFFIISGYLVFQSLMRSTDLIDYVWKRVLRIFPALLVVLALTVLLGPVVYEGLPGTYWSNPEVWTYFPRNAMLYTLQYSIKGIFDTTPYPNVINGSLWTICYEFTCYMGLAFLLFFRKWPWFIIQSLLLLGFLASSIADVFYFDILKNHWFFINAGHLSGLLSYFLGGSVLAAFRYERFKYHDIAIAISTVAILISIYFGVFRSGPHFVFLPCVVIGLGIKSTPVLRDIGEKIGDISYGIYIYGFPVQQFLMHFFALDYITLFFATLPTTFILGYLSWHLIEKRALKLKNLRPLALLKRIL
jgi:peptidoglycan/LPS O-acetylase OafA/YrhL